MDIRHFYIERGSGEPLLLLHGNGQDCGYFEKQLEEFSAGHRVIAVDTRGHGRTPRGDAPFTIRQFADDLAGFMDALELDSADILGFSDGANIAMCFAMKYPRRVKKLILNGGNLNTKGVRPSIQVPIEIGYRIASLFSAKNPQARKNAELLGLMVNEPNIDPEDLAGIAAATLVIAGTRDMIRRRHTELIAERIPHAQLVFIEGDHFIASKNPAAFDQAVKAFLRS